MRRLSRLLGGVRFKLMTLLVVVVVLANAAAALFAANFIRSIFLREVQTRIRLDLNSARQVYNNRVASLEQLLAAASYDERVQNPSGDLSDVRAEDVLQNLISLNSDIDFLMLVSAEGEVLFKNWDGSEQDVLSGDMLFEAARKSGKAVRGSMLLPPQFVDLLPESVRSRVQIPIDGQGDSSKLRAALAVGAVVPVPYHHTQPGSYLYAGSLLAKRYELVDVIKDSVFQRKSYKGREIGTATIFQGRVRISTNVKDNESQRAVGTLLSEEVSERVLERGEVWSDRAYVVNAWYITAYEPIRDPKGRVIGALYVGVLEAPYNNVQLLIRNVFFLLLAFAALATLLLAFFALRQVLSPVGTIVAAVRSLMKGDSSARVEIRPPGEMGLLCRAVDKMAEAVEERESMLKESTQRQIGQAEKLASIGRLAAGVAHEINNPLTGVLTFSHLLAESGELKGQQKEDLDMIIQQTSRVKEIVQGLLGFARETPTCKVSFSVNESINQLIRLVKGQREFDNVQICLELSKDDPIVFGDRNQLQQVILNLVFNACQAMPLGGTLTIETKDCEDAATISVSDTGDGINEEDLGRIFDPFFTTKPVGKGTGLGLSISYGIIKRHGGDIEVETEQGIGTTFRVTVPRPREPGEEAQGEDWDA